MRRILGTAGIALGVLLAGALGSCGGGGSSSSSGSSGSTGGTGGNSAGGNTIATAASNVAPIVVDAGPANTINLPFVTVTVCVPGSTTNCQTIDHVLVDTGSSGLRVIASVLSTTLKQALPQISDASSNSLAECTQFADGVAWGPIKRADVKVSGEVAASIPIQVIGDPAFASTPTACSSGGPLENTVATFGSNGVLGVGLFIQDCGSACVASVAPGIYYGCPVSGCQPTIASLDRQVQNPVPKFALNNNGVIVQLPAVGDNGAASVTGALVFGIGTQANNGLGSATVFTADASNGFITTTFNGQALAQSFIDSGSSVYFFQNGSTPLCSGSVSSAGLYCPTATQALTAQNKGVNAATGTVNFSVANGTTVLANNPANRAFNNLAAPSGSFPSSFDWGLPFFLGRNVFTAIEGKSTPGGAGPFFAY